MKQALYEVKIGDKKYQTDNFSSERVIAEDAMDAIKKVKVDTKNGFYVSEVKLLGRAT